MLETGAGANIQKNNTLNNGVQFISPEGQTKLQIQTKHYRIYLYVALEVTICQTNLQI